MSIAQSRSARRSGKWGRLALWLGLAFVAATVIGGLSAYAWVRRYLASEEFRALMAARAGQVLGAEVEIAPLVWDRLAVRSDKITSAGGGAFSRLQIDDPRATVSLSALTTGIWTIDDARAENVTVDLKRRSASSPVAATDAPPTDESLVPEDALAADDFGSGLPGWFPTKVSVPAIQIRRLNLRFGQGDMDFRILGAGALLQQRDATNFDLALRGGSFRLAPFPGSGITEKAFDIRDANARLAPEAVYLLGGTMSAADGTKLFLEGNIPAPGAPGSLEIHYILSSLPVSQILGADWTNRIFGRLAIDGRSRPEGDAMVHEGTAELGDAKFLTPAEKNPVTAAATTAAGAAGLLDRGWQSLTGTVIPILGAYTDRTTQFRNLVCDTALCQFRKKGEHIALHGIQIRSRGLLGIEGTLQIRGRGLDGQLMVGVSRQTLAGIPGAEAKVFTIERDGLVWTPVRVSGTLDEPKEDLTRRLLDAAGQRMMETLPDLSALKAAAGELVAPDGAMRQGAGSLLEQGTRLLQDGTGLLDGVLTLPREPTAPPEPEAPAPVPTPEPQSPAAPVPPPPQTGQ